MTDQEILDALEKLGSQSAVARFFKVSRQAINARIRKMQGKTRKQNRDYQRTYQREWRRSHAGKCREWDRRWRNENREHYRSYCRNRYHTTKGCKMPAITTRVSEATEKWLVANCRNKTSGAEYILDAFPTIYARTILGLRGKFTGNEIALLIDTFNSTMLTPQLAGQHLVLSAADSMELDRTDEKWSVEPKDFLARLQALSHFERAVLEIFVRAYWESPETGDGLKEPGSLEAWVEKIASSPIKLDGV